MKIMTDEDYAVLYAEKLRRDNGLFGQQNMLIESQMRSSSSIFKQLFAIKDFKQTPRKYLKQTGLL